MLIFSTFLFLAILIIVATTCLTNHGSPSVPVIPAPTSPPPTPVPLEPSCYVKGLIKSMETEPEKWKKEEAKEQIYYAGYIRPHFFCFIFWKHEPTGEIIYLREGSDEISTSIKIADYEKILLKNAIKRCLSDPPLIKARQEREKAQAARRAHFESLGCS